MTPDRNAADASITTTRRRFLAATTASALGVTGCLAEVTGDQEPDAEVDVKTYPNQEFTPSLVHVPVGGTVRWMNRSGSHDVTAYHPDNCGRPQRIPDEAEPWSSSTMSQVGDSFVHTFDVEGVYDYLDTQTVCVPHEAVGMVGRVVVGEPELEDQPAMQPPELGEEMPRVAANKIEEFNRRTREKLRG